MNIKKLLIPILGLTFFIGGSAKAIEYYYKVDFVLKGEEAFNKAFYGYSENPSNFTRTFSMDDCSDGNGGADITIKGIGNNQLLLTIDRAGENNDKEVILTKRILKDVSSEDEYFYVSGKRERDSEASWTYGLSFDDPKNKRRYIRHTILYSFDGQDNGFADFLDYSQEERKYKKDSYSKTKVSFFCSGGY